MLPEHGCPFDHTALREKQATSPVVRRTMSDGTPFVDVLGNNLTLKERYNGRYKAQAKREPSKSGFADFHTIEELDLSTIYDNINPFNYDLLTAAQYFYEGTANEYPAKQREHVLRALRTVLTGVTLFSESTYLTQDLDMLKQLVADPRILIRFAECLPLDQMFSMNNSAVIGLPIEEMRIGYAHGPDLGGQWESLLQASLIKNNNNPYIDEAVTALLPDILKGLHTYYMHYREARAKLTKNHLSREIQTQLNPLTDQLNVVPDDQKLPNGLRVIGDEGFTINTPFYTHSVPGADLGREKNMHHRGAIAIWEEQKSRILGSLIAPTSHVQRSFSTDDVPAIPIGEYGLGHATALAAVGDMLHERITEIFKENRFQRIDPHFITSSNPMALACQAVDSITQGIALLTFNSVDGVSDQELTLRLLDDPSLLLILSQKLIFGELGGMVSARRRAFPPNPIQLINDTLHFSPQWEELLKLQADYKHDIGYMKRTGSMQFQYTNTDIVGEGCPGARMIVPMTRVIKPWYLWYLAQNPQITKTKNHYLAIEKGLEIL